MEDGISIDAAAGDTRAAFVKAAKRLFAERGFYGTSIAAIATELDLTKQALIHHFGTKERLYGEVLEELAGHLTKAVGKADATSSAPGRQIEALLLGIYKNTLDFPEDTRLLMRELLDNRVRAERAHHWYLKDFLQAVVALARKAPGTKGLSETEVLARVYMILGAINYFAISEPTLKEMYGKSTFGALKNQMPAEIRQLVRTAFGD